MKEVESKAKKLSASRKSSYSPTPKRVNPMVKDSCNLVSMVELNKSPQARRKIYDLEHQLRLQKQANFNLTQSVDAHKEGKEILQDALKRSEFVRIQQEKDYERRIKELSRENRRLTSALDLSQEQYSLSTKILSHTIVVKEQYEDVIKKALRQENLADEMKSIMSCF